jgi:hypothetical protein
LDNIHPLQRLLHGNEWDIKYNKNANEPISIQPLPPKQSPHSKPSIDPSIPEEYHRHWEVFDEIAAKRFPPARNEDHVITLKDGAPDVLDCKIYRQTAAEEEATQTFIKEHLDKGYITPSNSPYTSPLFYRKKKDRSLRPIMDYRVLNSWMIRDVYPLPLISTILNHLQGKSIFTKFDIRWGYENI